MNEHNTYENVSEDPMSIDSNENSSEENIISFSNQAIDEKMLDEIFKYIQGNPNIYELELTNIQMDYSGWNRLFKFLATNQSITVLNLSDNDLCGNGKHDRWKAKLIREFLKQNQSLKEFYLNNCSLTSDDVESLFNAIEDNAFTAIELISLSKNALGNESLNCIGKFLLSCNNTVKHLTLVENDITSISPIVLGLQKKSSLRTINLSKNPIGDQGAKELAWVLKNNHTIKELRIYECGIGPNGAIYLAHSLKLNNTLEEIDINSNQIGNKGCQYFIHTLNTHNRKLNSCNFTGNGITYEILLNVADLIRNNCVLTTLTLFNKINEENEYETDNEGMLSKILLSALEEALMNNFSLISLGSLHLDSHSQYFHRRRYNPERLNSIYHSVWDYLDRNNNFYNLYLEYEAILELLRNPMINPEDKSESLNNFLSKAAFHLGDIEEMLNESTKAPKLLEIHWFKTWCELEKKIKNIPIVSLSDHFISYEQQYIELLFHITQHIEMHYPNEATEFDHLFNYFWQRMHALYPNSNELKSVFEEINRRLFIPCFQSIELEQKILLIKDEIVEIWQSLSCLKLNDTLIQQMQNLQKRLNNTEDMIQHDKLGSYQSFNLILNELKEIWRKEGNTLQIRNNLQFFTNQGDNNNNGDYSSFYKSTNR